MATTADATAANIIAVGDATYMPEVHVVFVGTRGKDTMMQTIETDALELPTSTTVKQIVIEVACERFRITSEDTVSTLLKDLEQASVYKTTALALASKFKVNIDEHVIIKPHEPPTDLAPTKPLFLIAEIKIEKLAPARATAAYTLFSALKMEASAQGIGLTESKLAGLCGIKSSNLSKALGRVPSSPSPLDGTTVAMLEQRIAKYRADLDTLKRDLIEAAAASSIVCKRAAPCTRRVAARACTLSPCLCLPERAVLPAARRAVRTAGGRCGLARDRGGRATGQEAQARVQQARLALPEPVRPRVDLLRGRPQHAQWDHEIHPRGRQARADHQLRRLGREVP
jgi:hypothetical protein